MPTDAKRQAVSELADLLRGSSALAVADYRGLTVSEMHQVRRSLRANGVRLQVAKNRLLKIAAEQAGLDQLKPMLEGPTAIAAAAGDEISLARALQEAFRPYKVVTLRGGLLAGQAVSAADLQRLASLPSREVLLGRLAGGLAAPLTGMAGVLAANLRNFVGVLNAVAEHKRQAERGTDAPPAATVIEPPRAEAVQAEVAEVKPDEAESPAETAQAELGEAEAAQAEATEPGAEVDAAPVDAAEADAAEAETSEAQAGPSPAEAD